MIFIVCIALLQETHEMEPIEYTMILPGIVMDETIDAGDEWFGLFEVEYGQYMLRPVELQLVEEEGTVYEGERPLGRIVELPCETDSPMILVASSLPVFSEGPVLSTLDFRLALPIGTSFILSSPGIVDLELDLTEEGMFISEDGVRQHLTQTYPSDGPEGPFIELMWAGDLDRDGRMDLLINDVENSYLIYKWDLYLSTEASPDQLAGYVASYFDVYY